MKQRNVLYQIKEFEKRMLRYFIQNSKVCLPFGHFPTPTQIEILDYLVEHDNENVCQKDLEKVLHLRRATVSGVLKTMEKNHLLERETSSEDARSKKIVLNQNARDIFERNRKNLLQMNEVVCAGITESELASFLNVLEKMKKNLEDKMD